MNFMKNLSSPLERNLGNLSSPLERFIKDNSFKIEW